MYGSRAMELDQFPRRPSHVPESSSVSKVGLRHQYASARVADWAIDPLNSQPGSRKRSEREMDQSEPVERAQEVLFACMGRSGSNLTNGILHQLASLEEGLGEGLEELRYALSDSARHESEARRPARRPVTDDDRTSHSAREVVVARIAERASAGLQSCEAGPRVHGPAVMARWL